MLFLLLILALFTVLFLNIGLGSVAVPWSDTWRIITQTASSQEVPQNVILQIRLPRALAVLFGGAALAVAGLLLQIFFANPIVDSYVLGTASGASLMVGLTLLAGAALGWTSAPALSLSLAACLGSLLIMLLVLVVARRVKQNATLLVVGLMVAYLCSAILSLVISFAEKEALQGFIFWSLGSFANITWPQLTVLALVTTLGIGAAALITKPLNALLLGEDYARSMGVSLARLRWVMILLTSILSGTVTAFAGPVAFIGLAVPHLGRMLLGTVDNRFLLPATVLLGAILTGGCDLAARLLLAPVELPLSAVTSFFGAPLVIGLLFRKEQPL